jgi:hypothetical protein
VDIDSGDVHEVPPFSIYATVSPDGQTLYFTRGTTEADIWMLTLNEKQQ